MQETAGPPPGGQTGRTGRINIRPMRDIEKRPRPGNGKKIPYFLAEGFGHNQRSPAFSEKPGFWTLPN